MMNLNRIKEFYYVARAGNITKAARELNVSQPALSRTIQLFEHHLDCKLFVRYARGLTLTPEGEKVYEFACRMVEEAGLLGKIVKINRLEGDLTVALAPYLSGGWFIKRLKDYVPLHADIRLKIIDQVDNLKPGEVDIMIGFEASPLSDAIKQILLKSKMAMFASAAYLKKYGMPKDLKALDDHQLISYSEDNKLPYKDKMPWILKNGNDRLPHLKVSCLEGMMSAACDDLGIVELPRDLAEIKAVGLVPVLPHLSGPEVALSFLYPPELKGRATIQSLKTYLLQDFKVAASSRAA